MPNPAVIAITYADGACKGIWLHFGTKPNQAGATLRQHYNNQSAAEALAGLGSIMCLESTPDACTRFLRMLPAITAPSHHVLFKHMNDGECLHGYHWNGQQWTIHDIGRSWTF